MPSEQSQDARIEAAAQAMCLDDGISWDDNLSDDTAAYYLKLACAALAAADGVSDPDALLARIETALDGAHDFLIGRGVEGAGLAGKCVNALAALDELRAARATADDGPTARVRAALEIHKQQHHRGQQDYGWFARDCLRDAALADAFVLAVYDAQTAP